MLGIVAVCVVVIAIVVLSWGRDSDVEIALKKGLRSNVACSNGECNWTSGDFRAQPDDEDWPKQCPKCEQTTLYRAEQCYVCQEMTYLKPEANGAVLCRHCKAVLVEPVGRR